MIKFIKRMLGIKRKTKTYIMITSFLFLNGCVTNITPNTSMQQGSNNQQTSTSVNNSISNNGISEKFFNNALESRLKPILKIENEQKNIITYLEKQSLKHNDDIENLEKEIDKDKNILRNISTQEKKEELILNSKINNKKKIIRIKKINHKLVLYLQN